jgi:hypothetical protein
MNKRFTQLIGLGLLMVLLNGCFGPKPVIVHYSLQTPQSPDQPHHLLVTLQNDSGGEGQAELTARLQVQATNQTVAEASQEVDLKEHETVTVTIPMQPSNPGPYQVSLEVHAPPQ